MNLTHRTTGGQIMKVWVLVGEDIIVGKDIIVGEDILADINVQKNVAANINFIY